VHVARVVPGRLGEHGQERDHVVVDLGLDREHARGIDARERRSRSLVPRGTSPRSSRVAVTASSTSSHSASRRASLHTSLISGRQ
jgi:hypothetical protein